jgi:hypothetical protein
LTDRRRKEGQTKGKNGQREGKNYTIDNEIKRGERSVQLIL